MRSAACSRAASRVSSIRSVTSGSPRPTTACRPKCSFPFPKKFHKRANRRNLLRRRAKEAYRLNKGLLLAEGGKTAAVDVALIYSSKEIVPYKTVENALRRILQQIAERL